MPRSIPTTQLRCLFHKVPFRHYWQTRVAPYAPPTTDSEPPSNTYDAADFFPTALISGTTTAAVSLVIWTVALISYIETLYQPNMGFWVIIMIGMSAISMIPVAAITFITSRHALIHNRGGYAQAFILCLILLLSATPILAWRQSNSLSLATTYAILGALMVTPPCLLGFATCGFVTAMRSSLSRKA